MNSNLYDFGLVGLGVMGRNFLLNIADHDFAVVGLDLDLEKVTSLQNEGGNKKVKATQDKTEFIRSLARPRRIMMLVPAGGPVDAVINDLLPLLDKGDIVIDGGNSFFKDTDRRIESLKSSGISFFGLGVSGGAEGARKGPSMMAGGDAEAYSHVQPIFEAVSAKVNGEPCVARVGNGSAGHYVKMVHNGIEYGLMQIIAESYDLMKYALGYSNEQIAAQFDQWNAGRLQSFLIEITAEIFKQKDDLTNGDLIDLISDKAKQKGTGKWISQNALDLGTPIPAIDASVSMRAISSFKEEREKAMLLYPKSEDDQVTVTIEELEATVLFSFTIAFAQGLKQLDEASHVYGFDLHLAEIAKIWRGGCIIRASLLEEIRSAFANNSTLEHLLFENDIVEIVNELLPKVSNVVSAAAQKGIPILSISASLNYFNAFRSGRLPLNLIQAQRDYFGAHTYERTDRPGVFHTNW
jgi:6-phosphogluconate dehydrogenase